MNISNSLTITTTEKNNNAINKNKISFWQGLKIARNTVAMTIAGGALGYLAGQLIDDFIREQACSKHYVDKGNCGDILEGANIASPVAIALASFGGVVLGFVGFNIFRKREIAIQQIQEPFINNKKNFTKKNIANNLDVV
jgi:hypothetical protein